MSHSVAVTSALQHDPSRSGLARQTVEFLVVLALSILLLRTFAAEAYVVPTGSMAPTLLGDHEEIICPNCGIRYALGRDEGSVAIRALCANCGTIANDPTTAVACSGDRVLVQKFLYDFRQPQRWEVAVFHFPGEPTQAYVKRVVGLPGEMIQIVRGDVMIDGRIARKTLREQRAMRILVFDNNYIPRDAVRTPRWQFRRGRPVHGLQTGWHPDGTRLVHDPTASEASSVAAEREPIDWLEYQHLRAERGSYGSVSDFMAYNGGEMHGENSIADLMLEAKLSHGVGVRDVTLRINSGADRFFVVLPIESEGPIEVRRNGRPLPPVTPRPEGLAAWSAAGSLPVHLEASVMDHRLMVAVNGLLLFDPIDYDDPAVFPSFDVSPVALGVRGGSVVLGDLRVHRDVHYTSSLTNIPRRPFGIDSPYLLGPDEFFVLGDNSPVSNDSRFWTASPVVRRELFLGKPFLVHLPGQVVPLKVFGRSVYWVPDPREIRYIR